MFNKIPKDLDEALKILIQKLEPEEIEIIKKNGIAGCHFTLGRCLRNKWNLWHKSILAKWFNKHEIWHADDMSGIILESLYRVLNNKPIDLEQQVQIYKDY